MRRLDHYWYNKNPLALLLAPLSWVFCLVSMLRRKGYQSRLLQVTRLPVPVIVVGNISVGGTGKTPLVVWLVHFLRQAGYSPAVVSRGYGGRGAGGAHPWPQRVTPDSDATVVGDEAVLLARRCGCPMAVAPKRVTAARMVSENDRCDVIICDDGLQHYALARDIEIAVVDGMRGFGNGYCLPAGPLREPPSRLKSVDFVVVNGEAAEVISPAAVLAHPRAHRTWASAVQGRAEAKGSTSAARGRRPKAACPAQFSMHLHHGVLRQVGDDNKTCDISDFYGHVVHAVAGIGHPARFFEHLKGLGLEIIEHAFPDHYPFTAQDLQFGDHPSLNSIVIMTEKDAVKCRGFSGENHWYMPVDAQLDSEFGERLLEKLTMRRKVSNG